MANIQTGGIVTGIRGSVGGVTYSKARNGGTVRQKAMPARRQRTTQPANRARLGYLARSWGQLSLLIRQAWETWASTHPFTDKFGEPFIGSGANSFTSINTVRMRLGPEFVYTEAPPVSELTASLASLTVAQGITNPGDIDVSWTFNGVESADDYVEIAIAGPFVGQGRQQVFNLKRYKTAVAGDESSETIEDLTEGAYYTVFARYVGEDGQTSAWHNGQATPMVTP